MTEREQAIIALKKEKFYMVEMNGGGLAASSERIPRKTDAEKLRSSCVGQSAVVWSVERQVNKEKPPKLYDFTTLQREANRFYGYTAQQTLITFSFYMKRSWRPIPGWYTAYLSFITENQKKPFY